MEPTNPRKRPLPASNADDSAIKSTPEQASKRQRHEGSAASLLSSSPAYISLLTPPPTANPTPNHKKPTISLALKIPQRIPNEKEKRQVAARKGAAKKWANEGKLQKPFPKPKEIKAAYDLKLLRHYPADTSTDGSKSSSPPSSSTSSASAPSPTPAANFIKPTIQKSSRVSKLLKSFPTLDIPVVTQETEAARQQRDMDEYALRKNMKLTASEAATRQAWESFAEPDRPSRELMVESALSSDDLEKEFRGEQNNLPEWKKHTTSRFA